MLTVLAVLLFTTVSDKPFSLSKFSNIPLVGLYFAVESGTNNGLIYFVCLCLRIVVSNTYCVVFLFAFLRLLYFIMSVSLDCPFLITPSVFSNVYLLIPVPMLINIKVPDHGTTVFFLII